MEFLDEVLGFASDPTGYVVNKATEFYEEHEAVIDGAATGALSGTVEGGLAYGPLGAAVGAVTGAVEGADAGDHEENPGRGLSDDEKAYLKEIYGENGLDYDAITVRDGSLRATGASRTIGNEINVQEGATYEDGTPVVYYNEDGTMTPEGLELLAHESMHSWQFQQGGSGYMVDSLMNQAKAFKEGGDRGEAYDYKKAMAEGKDWSEWNAEQQAECIEKWNHARVRLQNPDLTDEARAKYQQQLDDLEPYHQKVLDGERAATFGVEDLPL